VHEAAAATATRQEHTSKEAIRGRTVSKKMNRRRKKKEDRRKKKKEKKKIADLE